MVKFKGQKLKLAKKIKFQDVISQWMQSIVILKSLNIRSLKLSKKGLNQSSVLGDKTDSQLLRNHYSANFL